MFGYGNTVVFYVLNLRWCLNGFNSLDIQSNPDIAPLFVHRNLWRYVGVVFNRNTVKYEIYVHRHSWALNETGAIPGFDCIFKVLNKV
jgi:hypothetical protein